MKKTMRRILKLILPGWVVRKRLASKYGIKQPSVSDSAYVRLLALLAPYAISAILLQRKPADRRVSKYFLPYGAMRRWLSVEYEMNIGNESLDKGVSGAVRAISPYGLVLWWDGEDSRLAADASRAKRESVEAAKKAAAAAKAKRDAEVAKRRRAAYEAEHRDWLEVLSLRTALGNVPTVSVVVTGSPTADELQDAVSHLAGQSANVKEIFLAMPGRRQDAPAAPDCGAAPKIVNVDGASLDRVRNEALEAAAGDYIVFLDMFDRYASRSALELLVLSARAHSAAVCGGSADEGCSECGRIGDLVFDRAWLQASGVRFVSGTDADDRMFVRMAKRVSSRSFLTDRRFSAYARGRRPPSVSPQERRMDVLRSLSNAARLAENAAPALKGAVLAEAEAAKTAIRELVWKYRAVSGPIDGLVREVSRALGDTRFADDVLKPRVSVIVPCVEQRQSWPECLDDILSQPFSSVEIIVIAQAGDAAVSGFAAIHPQTVRVLDAEGDFSSSMNAGLEMATGKYVCFADCADRIDGGALKRLASSLDGDDSAEMAAYGLADSMGPLSPERARDVEMSSCRMLVRRDFLEKNRIRFPKGVKDGGIAFLFFVLGKVANARTVKAQCTLSGCMAPFRSQQRSFEDEVDTLSTAGRYLIADDRRDLLGVFFRHVADVASRHGGDDGLELLAQVLHDVDFYYNREFLDARDLGAVDTALRELYNRSAVGRHAPVADESQFPCLRRREPRRDSPLLTYIVPAFNQERYFSVCIESLRRQTESNIEIICVDDGSTDHTWSLMELYAAIDGRITVFHQENAGVSAARNFAMRQARGRYVSFVDADDFVDLDMAKSVTERMMRDNLEICLFDLQCFDYGTRAPLEHYWLLKKHASAYPKEQVFSFGDLREFASFGGVVCAAWSRAFIADNGLSFMPLVNGEDMMFWMYAWPRVARAGLLTNAFYHYRRGNPTSAVSSRASSAGDVTVRRYLEAMAECWEKSRVALDSHAATLLAGRMIYELNYYGSHRPRILDFLQQEGFARFDFMAFRPSGNLPGHWQKHIQMRERSSQPAGDAVSSGCEDAMKMMSSGARKAAERIMAARASSVKDLYIITGQLNSTENEPIDSWTFFKWLQDHGIPSRYVVWKKHKMVPKLRASGELKDVILLSGDGRENFEFIEKCEDALVRCKIVAQENGALNGWVRKWLYFLPGCQYTFLEHGIKFWKYTSAMGDFFATFNVINNSSAFEKDLLEKNLPGHYLTGIRPKCIVGGLPRFDLLKDERGKDRRERHVFVMFTWRRAFSEGQDVLVKSAYYNGIRALMSDANVKRLADMGVKLVLSAHHHLVNKIKDLNFGPAIKIVPQDEVAYWKSHADCCITDYSSITFDFLFLGKPVVYWVPDREDMLLLPDDYAEIVEAESRRKHIFNTVDTVAEVMELVEHYAKTDFVLEPEKAEIASKFFAVRKDFCGHLFSALEAVSSK